MLGLFGCWVLTKDAIATRDSCNNECTAPLSSGESADKTLERLAILTELESGQTGILK